MINRQNMMFLLVERLQPGYYLGWVLVSKFGCVQYMDLKEHFYLLFE